MTSVPTHKSPAPAASLGTLSRRAALGTLAASAAGFALFGPRGAKERSDGKIVLDYWEKWTGHEGRAMQKVVDEFNATIGEQKKIFVRYLVTAGIDQKTLIAVAGGNPPDLVGLWNYNIPLYAESNAILPLDDLGSSHNVKLENYAAGFRPVLEHPDATGKKRMWGVVNTGGTVAMYYNKAAFREVGLDPQRPPRTISELDEYDKRLSIINPDGTIQRAGFIHAEPGWWSWIWGYHFGGSLADIAHNKSLAASKENVEAFEWVQSYSKRWQVRHGRPRPLARQRHQRQEARLRLWRRVLPRARRSLQRTHALWPRRLRRSRHPPWREKPRSKHGVRRIHAAPTSRRIHRTRALQELTPRDQQQRLPRNPSQPRRPRPRRDRAE
jgi:hypothetical protein